MNKKNKKIDILKSPTHGYSDVYPLREIWREIANDLNGKFSIKSNSGNEIEIHNISIPHKKWNLEISNSDTRPLKFQMSCLANQDFELILSWEDFIERIFKKFSKPEIELGWMDFDKQYLIKSNLPDVVMRILTREIQETLLKHNVYNISYLTDSKTKTAELVSIIQKIPEDKETVLDLITMYRHLIDNLESAGIIK